MTVRTFNGPSLLAHLLPAVVLNSVIALGITAFGEHAFSSNWVYSQCIGLSIGTLIMLGIRWRIPDWETQWRRIVFIVPLAAVSALVLGGAGALALRSRRRPVVSGVEAMLGTTAEGLEAFEREGWVRASGERWRARSAAPLACGERARIVAVEGLLLVVEPEVGKGERI